MAFLSRRFFVIAPACVLALPAALRAVAAVKPTRIALLLPGSIADGGWDQLAYEGLQALGGDPGFTVAHTEKVSQAQMEQAVRGYADDGYDLVIGHSFEYGSAFDEIAPDYPKTKFFASTFKPAEKVPGNVEFINLAYLQGAYGAGALAALISDKGGAVGFVGGGDNPTQKSMMKAFIVGAERTRPGMKGLGIVTGDYDNAAKGREAASIMIGNGADVIWHAADVTGLGALQGAAAAHVKAIGCYSDQTAVAPDWIATNFMLNLPWVIEQVGHSVQDGSFKGGAEWQPTPAQIWLFKAGSNGDHNPKLVSAESWSKFQSIWHEVDAGRINVASLAKS